MTVSYLNKHDERFVGMGFREESFQLPRICLAFERKDHFLPSRINKSLPFLDTLLDNSNLKPISKPSANSMQILLNYTVHKFFLVLE
jgi:hypothetical protein